MKDALAGLRILDFCWVGAGALVTKLLAEHGAEVIKVESRARPDNLRLSPPYAPGAAHLEGSGYFASRNNDKKSFALNMRRPEAHELARMLAARCDLVTNNFRPGVMERWGLGYADVAELNRSVIYLSMSMHGSTGPNRQYIGFGSTIAAVSGLVHLSGRRDREPIGTGTHYPDHIPSPGHALVAVLGAIRQRQRTGRGSLIEVSQLEATVDMIGPAIAAASDGGSPPERQGNRTESACPSGVFRCAGPDEWCAVSVCNDAQWRAFTLALGQPELADDPRFTTHDQRKHNEDALEEAIAGLVLAWNRDELANALQRSGVPAWRVQSSADLLADEQLVGRAFWRKVVHPEIGVITAPASPFRADGERTGPTRPAPLLGQHTHEIASTLLGLSDYEIDRLTETQVLW